MFNFFCSPAEIFALGMQHKTSNPKKFIKMMNIAVQKGNVDGMIEAGLFYSNSDLNKAFGYFKSAANKGSARGFHNMAAVYARQGKLDLAMEYYSYAAEQHLPLAHKELSLIYGKQNNNILSLAHAIYALAYTADEGGWVDELRLYYSTLLATLSNEVYHIALGIATKFALHEFNDVILESQKHLRDAPEIHEQLMYCLTTGDNRVDLSTSGYLRLLNPIAQRFNVNPIDIHIGAASFSAYALQAQ